jgi:hypothetical protein
MRRVGLTSNTDDRLAESWAMAVPDTHIAIVGFTDLQAGV